LGAGGDLVKAKKSDEEQCEEKESIRLSSVLLGEKGRCEGLQDMHPMGEHAH